MHGRIFRAGLGGILHLHIAIETQAQIAHRHHQQAKDSSKNCEFDGGGSALGPCKFAIFTFHDLTFRYSTRLDLEVPIGRVP